MAMHNPPHPGAFIQEVYLTKVRAKKEEVVRMVGLRCAALGLQRMVASREIRSLAAGRTFGTNSCRPPLKSDCI